MSTDVINIDLEERTTLGKGLAQIRADGNVPAVIHNHGQASIHVQGTFKELSRVYAAAGKHHPVQVKVAGKQHLALIKDVDFEPAKNRMRHVVFQAIRQNEEVEAEVPVVFAEADIPAEKVSLLVLKQLDHVQVKALPRDLPDQLVVDPSSLSEVGDSLSVADLKVPAGVTVLSLPETQIAIVEMPKDQIAEADAAQAALADDAGTVEDETAEAEESTEESATEETAPEA